MNPYKLVGKTHFMLLLCLTAGTLAIFYCPPHTAPSLPAFFVLLGLLSGAQAYRSTKEDPALPSAQGGNIGR